MNDSPAVILYDAYGNEIALADGYSISVDTKGIPIIIINDNNEAKFIRADSDGYVFSSVRVNEKLPAGDNIIGKVGVDLNDTGGLALETTQQTLATEETLIDAYNKINSLESFDFSTEDTLFDAYNILESIKDTDGIKKINDALPEGDNSIGRVKLIDQNGIPIYASTSSDGYNRLFVDGYFTGGLSRVINVNESNLPITVDKRGNIRYLAVKDIDQVSFLQEILKELKKIKMYLKIMAD